MTQINLFDEDSDEFLRNLIQQHGEKGALDIIAKMQGYEVTPPTVQEFVDNEYYLGKFLGNKLFPTWREGLQDIFPTPYYSPYMEICFSGDTEVDLLDGRTLTMKEIATEFSGKEFDVLAYDTQTNQWKPSKGINPIRTRVKAPVWKVTLDNGKSFKATEDHNLMTRDNKKIKVKDLVPGKTELKSYRKYRNKQGYDIIWDHSEKKYVALHKIVAKAKTTIPKGHHVHHLNFIHEDNRPSNLRVLSQKNHFSYHSHVITTNMKDPEFKKENGEKISKALKKFYDSERGDERKKIQSEIQKSRMSDNKYKERIIKTMHTAQNAWVKTEEGIQISRDNFQKWRDSLSPEDFKRIHEERCTKGLETRWQGENNEEYRQQTSERMSWQMEMGQSEYMSNIRWNDPEKSPQRKAEMSAWFKEQNKKDGHTRQPNARRNKVLSHINKVLNHHNLDYIKMEDYDKLRFVGEKYNVRLRGIAKVFEKTKTNRHGWVMADKDALKEIWDDIIEQAKNYNHKVVSVEFAGYEDVYNFEVKDYNTYTLSAGCTTFNCITGSIGTGKSTFSLAGVCYDLCRTLCLKNPHDHYGIIHSDKIAVALMNATQKLAGGVLLDQLKEWVSNSPFFKTRLDKSKGARTMFKKGIDVVMGSRASDILGMATISVVLSELNFQDKVAAQAYENYTNARIRMKSRYDMTYNKTGFYPGRLWLDSSKNADISFMEAHAEDNEESDMVRVFDYAYWEVHSRRKTPDGRPFYSGDTFEMFIGDKTRDPFLIKNDNQKIGIKEELIIKVPVEHREDFENDKFRALRDLAGKVSWSSSTFITSGQKLNDAFTRPNPVYKEEIVLDFFDSNQRLIDYIRHEEVLLDTRPRFIHIDIALTGDRLGIACTRVNGFRTIERIEQATGKIYKEREPLFYTDWVLPISNVANQEIPIYKIKNLVTDLQKKGYPIVKVSCDGYQSRNLLQDLLLMGITTEVISVDRTKDPYLYLKSCILEGRYSGVANPILERELKNLRDTDKKIDHLPALAGQEHLPGQCSKDLTDAICGSVWSARYGIAKYGANVSSEDYIKAARELRQGAGNNEYQDLLKSMRDVSDFNRQWGLGKKTGFLR